MNSNINRGEQLFSAFSKFHLENPDIWTLFKNYTHEIIQRGFNHYSANAVFERIRWHNDIEKLENRALKLNNNFRCFYARLFHVAYPQYDGFFRNRKRISEEKEFKSNDIQEWPSVDPGDESVYQSRLLDLLKSNQS